MVFTLFLFIMGCSSSSVFQLTPDQSMLITGKGPGQDAAINPYQNQKSIAIIQNLGKTPVSVRIQNNKNLLINRDILGSSTNTFTLEIGDELYLDATAPAKAKVTFKKWR